MLAAGLVEDALERYGAEAVEEIVRVPGSLFKGLRLRHPFYDREVPVILTDYVTLDAGTGAVHTAPGHGHDDFAAGVEHDLPLDNPVDGRGIYIEGTEIFGGQHIYKANAKIVDTLAERGKLLNAVEFGHSYPHCWRHNTPVIFRATPQWFVSLDQNGLREASMAAIRTVEWIPDWGQQRIESMVENRPDWCISRQRTWGVPIPLFTHVDTDEIHPRTPELLEQVASLMEEGGIDAWFDLESRTLIGDDADQYRKVTDTMDVWMDSGMVHHCVSGNRDELASPADLYLEGSDQHRGWFQSSLLTSMAMESRPPYRQVLTHGFTVDEHGRKMSKRLGNQVVPQKVINKLGADVLRLWVAATDYSGEMSVSDEILTRTSDSYRRIRNTARYLLGNLHGFDPASDSLPFDELVDLDKWAIGRAAALQESILEAYERYEFHRIYQDLHNFCVVDMGGFYLDVIKDRLYTTGADSHPRRSAQTAMMQIAEAMVRWIAPILSFTAEEIWRALPGDRAESVFFATWSKLETPAELAVNWDSLLAIRDTVSKVLEEARKADQIGKSLNATVTIFAHSDLRGELEVLGEELRFVFITSEAEVRPADERPAECTEGEGYWVAAAPSDARKCIRCWHQREDVGANEAHPELCGRCVDNVAGPGERRMYA